MSAKAKKKGRKGVMVAIVVIIVVVIVLLVSLMLGNKKGLYDEFTLAKGSISTYYSFSGNVESQNVQNIMAKSVMQISDIKVKEQQKVKKGQVLFETSDGTEIKSEIKGTVSELYVSQDEQVMSGGKLCDIIDFDNTQVTVKVDEYDLSSIKKGKDVNITIGAIDKEIDGNVYSISDTAVNQNGVAYFTAVINLQRDSDIKIGMTAEATILNEEAKDVVVLDMDALQFDDEDKPFVLVKKDSDEPEKRYIEVGINDGKYVEIKSGATEQDVICFPKSLKIMSNDFVPPMMRG